MHALPLPAMYLELDISIETLCCAKTHNRCHQSERCHSLYASKAAYAEGCGRRGPSMFKMSSSIAGTGKRYTSHLYPPTAFPPSFPYSLADLQASDSQPDSIFYRPSRFVNHIDDHAIKALEEYYGAHLPPTPNPSSTSTSQSTTSNPGAPSARILDLCSSWVSHIPFQTPSKNRQVVGLGMNASELSENPILTAWVVHDLNQTPDFHEALENTSKGKAAPSSSSSSSSAPSTSVSDRTKFDAVICNVSIDYLTRPLEVMKSIWDHLEEGGYAYMAISNRCFPNKVSVKPITTPHLLDEIVVLKQYTTSGCSSLAPVVH